LSNTPPNDGRALGVRAIMLLLFGVLCTLCARAKGFLIVDTGRATEGVRVGVAAAGVWTLALKLLFPGAVIESLPDDVPNRFGVAGTGWKVPSLVVGLLPLLDIAEAGRSGGGMLLSALKKFDLRLPFPPAGDEGSWERLSIVRSERDGRDFFVVAGSGAGSGSGSTGDSASTSCSIS
jgi:hypothetical protein